MEASMAGGGEEEDRRGEEGVRGGGEEGERGGGEAVEFGGVEEGRRGERRPLRQLLGDGSAHSGCTMYRHTRREISVSKKEREGEGGRGRVPSHLRPGLMIVMIDLQKLQKVERRREKGRNT